MIVKNTPNATIVRQFWLKSYSSSHRTSSAPQVVADGYFRTNIQQSTIRVMDDDKLTMKVTRR